MTAEPSAEERAAVDEVLGPPATGWDGGRGPLATCASRASRRPPHDAAPGAARAAGRVGWISEGGLNYACERLRCRRPRRTASRPSTRCSASRSARGPWSTSVTTWRAASRAGRSCCRVAARRPRRRDWARSPCLGMCERAPALLAQGSGEAADVVARGGDRGDASARSWRRDRGAWRAPSCSAEARTPAARRTGCSPRVGRTSIPSRRRVSLARRLRGARARAIELGPDAVIQQVTDAKLLGRGGAAFPTGVKWRAVADQSVGRST